MKENEIVKAVLRHYPEVQAVYLFGTSGTEDEWPDSDVDVALLFSPAKAAKTGSLLMSDLWLELEKLLKKDVDLINLRMVNTVLQKEIISANQRIYCADEYAADEFEMLALSYYQKLDIKLMIDVIENHLNDLVDFTNYIVKEFADGTTP